MRHVEIVRLLVENGADVNSRYSDGWSALEIASNRSRGLTLSSGERLTYLEIVRLLVENGVDANTRYSDGRSVLLWAADQMGY